MPDRDYKDYLYDILSSCEDIKKFVDKMSKEDFVWDKKTSYAVVRAIEVIGEASKHIPDTARQKYSTVPREQMAAMRDKLIHDYFGIDADILWETIQTDIPFIETEIKKVK